MRAPAGAGRVRAVLGGTLPIGLALLLGGAACAGDGEAPGGAASPDAGAGQTAGPLGPCAEGFAPLPDGEGCAAVLPPEPCGPGTRAAVGSATCVPVGVRACGAGFELDASGWGCRAVIAPRCTGATRAALGAAACVPVGDCAAAFPPAGATRFVDASYGPGQLDATHHATIGAALAASRGGDLVAVESGTYVGTLLVRTGVRIVGRCAARVVVTPQAEGVPGVQATGASTVAFVAGLTLRGFGNGLLVAEGASVQATDVVVEGASRRGVAVTDDGSSVVLRRSVVRALRPTADAGQVFGAFAQRRARLTLEDTELSDLEFSGLVAHEGGVVEARRSVVRDVVPRREGASAGKLGVAVNVQAGGRLLFEDGLVERATSGGVLATLSTATSRAHAVVRGSVVAGVVDPVTAGKPGDSGPEPVYGGVGVESTVGSLVEIEGSTVEGSSSYEMVALKGAELVVSDSTTRGASDPAIPGAPGLAAVGAKVVARSVAIVSPRGVGCGAAQDGTFELVDSLVLDPVVGPAPSIPYGLLGAGLSASRGGSVSLARSTIVGASGGAITASAASFVTLDAIAVLDTRPSDGRGGRALVAQGGARVRAERSTFERSEEIAVVSFDEGTELELSDCAVRDVRPTRDGRMGYGAGAFDGSALRITGTTLAAATAGVVAGSGSVSVAGGTVSRCTTAFHGDPTTDVVVEDPPTIAPSRIAVSSSTRVVANETRVSRGELPLPARLE